MGTINCLEEKDAKGGHVSLNFHSAVDLRIHV